MGALSILPLTTIAVCSLAILAQGASLNILDEEDRIDTGASEDLLDIEDRLLNTDNNWGNVNCGLHTRRIGIRVNNGSSFRFTSQRRGQPQYKDNTDCRVMYLPGEKCHKIQFTCSQVAAKAKWNKPDQHYRNNTKPTSSRFCFGDFLRVKSQGKTHRNCRGSKPTVNSTRSISVFFHANPRIVSQGAVCSVDCVEDTSNWEGVIVSPNPFPASGMYSPPSESISVASGYWIKFTYKKFNIPTTMCGSDNYFEIGDMMTNTINTGRMCGGLVEGQNTFTVQDNTAYIYITTTNAPAGTEWEVTWEAIPDPTASRSLLDIMDLPLDQLDKALDDMDAEEDDLDYMEDDEE